MYKIIIIESEKELETLCEADGTLAQLKLNNETKTFQRINGQWIEVNIYLG